jgi:transcription antitermination factor NusG
MLVAERRKQYYVVRLLNPNYRKRVREALLLCPVVAELIVPMKTVDDGRGKRSVPSLENYAFLHLPSGVEAIQHCVDFVRSELYGVMWFIGRRPLTDLEVEWLVVFLKQGTPGLEDVRPRLLVGDVVRVNRGSLESILGKVFRVDSDRCMVRLRSSDGFHIPLSAPMDALELLNA